MNELLSQILQHQGQQKEDSVEQSTPAGRTEQVEGNEARFQTPPSKKYNVVGTVGTLNKTITSNVKPASSPAKLGHSNKGSGSKSEAASSSPEVTRQQTEDKQA